MEHFTDFFTNRKIKLKFPINVNDSYKDIKEKIKPEDTKQFKEGMDAIKEKIQSLPSAVSNLGKTAPEDLKKVEKILKTSSHLKGSHA